MEEVAVTIIGAGVIGLSIARAISKWGKDVVVIEKNRSFGEGTSSRNSEVIHSGIYYPPGSLKSITCLRGKELLYQYCQRNSIPHKKLGKILIASDDEEEKKIRAIYENAIKVGIRNLSILDKKDIQKLQPQVTGKFGIFCPDSGILDSHSFMKSLYQEAKEQGVIFSFCSEVVGIERKNGKYLLHIKDADGEKFSFLSQIVINSAGLYSDRIASMVGISNYKIYYCKGRYFRIRNPSKYNIKYLIYPPPTEISLGIHITPDIGGGLRLGPDAQYVNEIDYKVDDQDKEIFYAEVKKFLPQLEMEDIIPDTAGIRPKLQKPGDGFRDFVIIEESVKGFSGFINLIGIESPGLTSSLAIAELVDKIVQKILMM